MNHFIKKTAFFIIVLFLVDKLFYFKIVSLAKKETDKRLELILEGKMNKDLLIFGSSRAQHDIIAYQIQDKTKLTTFNLGYRGASISFQLFLLKKLLKHNKKPLKIILTLDDDTEFFDEKTLQFRYDKLYSLIKYQEITSELIQQKQISPFAYCLFSARLNKTSFMKQKKTTKFDQFLPCGTVLLEGSSPKANFNYKKEVNYNNKLEFSQKVFFFKDFQQICHQNKIELTVVFPPNFKNHNSSFEKRIRELVLPKTKLYIYNKKNFRYLNKHYFYDESHLNIKGAKVFTKGLINYIQN